MTEKTGKCSNKSCPRTAAVVGLCKPCYAGVRYWVRKAARLGVKVITDRQLALAIAEERLDSVSTGNVRSFRRRRAA